jgi:hypothetical protein
MTAQSRSPDDADRQSLVEFLVPSRRSSLPPAPAKDQAEEAPIAADEARDISAEADESPTPPDAPARSQIGSSLRPITVDPTPRPSPDDEDRALASVVPPPPLRALRKLGVRVAAVLAAGALVFGIRRAVTSQPAPPSRAPVVAASPRIPEEPPPAAPPDESGDDLDDPGVLPDVEAGQRATREARRLLEAGKVQEGVAQARKAIGLNPADSQNYILLAAGLQDLGKWQEAREIFSKCVHQPTGDRNAECVYFATHPGR